MSHSAQKPFNLSFHASLSESFRLSDVTVGGKNSRWTCQVQDNLRKCTWGNILNSAVSTMSETGDMMEAPS